MSRFLCFGAFMLRRESRSTMRMFRFRFSLGSRFRVWGLGLGLTRKAGETCVCASEVGKDILMYKYRECKYTDVQTGLVASSSSGSTKLNKLNYIN